MTYDEVRGEALKIDDDVARIWYLMNQLGEYTCEEFRKVIEQINEEYYSLKSTER